MRETENSYYVFERTEGNIIFALLLVIGYTGGALSVLLF